MESSHVFTSCISLKWHWLWWPVSIHFKSKDKNSQVLIMVISHLLSSKGIIHTYIQVETWSSTLPKSTMFSNPVSAMTCTVQKPLTSHYAQQIVTLSRSVQSQVKSGKSFTVWDFTSCSCLHISKWTILHVCHDLGQIYIKPSQYFCLKGNKMQVNFEKNPKE